MRIVRVTEISGSEAPNSGKFFSSSWFRKSALVPSSMRPLLEIDTESASAAVPNKVEGPPRHNRQSLPTLPATGFVPYTCQAPPIPQRPYAGPPSAIRVTTDSSLILGKSQSQTFRHPSIRSFIFSAYFRPMPTLGSPLISGHASDRKRLQQGDHAAVHAAWRPSVPNRCSSPIATGPGVHFSAAQSARHISFPTAKAWPRDSPTP